MCSYCRQVCLVAIYEKCCILTYVMEVMKLKPCFLHAERWFPQQADNKLIRASQVKGNAFRKATSAHRAQVPHPRGKTPVAAMLWKGSLFQMGYRWRTGTEAFPMQRLQLGKQSLQARKMLTCLLARQAVSKATQVTAAVHWHVQTAGTRPWDEDGVWPVVSTGGHFLWVGLLRPLKFQVWW